MEITEVRIKLMEGSEDRLRAFCSITFDNCFVVRDLKIIDGAHGPFVAMPSRKLTGHCQRCSHKNHLRALYCNQCGVKLRVDSSSESPQKLYADVAHPINSMCREMIQNAVIEELEEELKRSGEPGYRSRYDDEFELDSGPEVDEFDEVVAGPQSSSHGLSSKPGLSHPAVDGPPKPHFDAPKSKSARRDQTQAVDNEPDDGFGAGIFS